MTLEELETFLATSGLRINTCGQDKDGVWHCSIRTHVKGVPDFGRGSNFQFSLGHGGSFASAFTAAVEAHKKPKEWTPRKTIAISLDDLDL